MRVLAALAAAALAAPATAHAAPGAAGIGDPLFPKLGNGGYDALHYDLDLRYPTTAPRQRIGGTVTMRARATQALSRFDLDYSGGTVGSVAVDGTAARFRRSGQELIVTPRRTLAKGHAFRARVTFVSGTHDPESSDKGFTTGWFTTADGSVMAGQPADTHTIFPVNDHPADKATYAFRIDVPEGITAVANGERTAKRTAGGRTVYRYAMRQPMASELVQVAAGLLKVTDAAARTASISAAPPTYRRERGRRGAQPHARPRRLDGQSASAATRSRTTACWPPTPASPTRWRRRRISLFPADLLEGAQTPAAVYEPVMVHELAHQWFGDSVAPERWSDVWLNEGHATWYEHEYGGQRVLRPVRGRLLQGRLPARRTSCAPLRPVAKPKGNRFNTLFSDNVYSGGGLVLYALQQTVGDPAFRAIERGWAQRERGKSVGTEDFIALASKVAHQDLGPFLRAWLYGTTVPPMPGHPDWTAAPVAASSSALRPSSVFPLRRY